ncbi:hypothetical protein JMJ55_04460 [Belnapia sp. T6]|uniref:Uncharacterized protein n=1 Tax=Belnapia mucosa TaxID=2804532 RepID=A0ABS1UYT8_9PROT|nr:hypothetical protein [Belnapia mucosa]MBL6454565.1 hypothetical protein [Belnapia mucosa]
MVDHTGLLVREYEAINAHLRSNIGQFVNWFSFFLTASFVALAAFLAVGDRWPEVRLMRLRYVVPGVFLFLHMLAFVGILIFRRYIAAASRRVEEIIAEAGEMGRSPIPVGFCKWMTNLMAAGFWSPISRGSWPCSSSGLPRLPQAAAALRGAAAEVREVGVEGNSLRHQTDTQRHPPAEAGAGCIRCWLASARVVSPRGAPFGISSATTLTSVDDRNSRHNRIVVERCLKRDVADSAREVRKHQDVTSVLIRTEAICRWNYLRGHSRV